MHLKKDKFFTLSLCFFANFISIPAVSSQRHKHINFAGCCRMSENLVQVFSYEILIDPRYLLLRTVSV
jgi:hypothetical protein